MVFSVIKKSQLEGALRIDAEYYQPEYLEMEKMIKKYTNFLLKDLITSFSSGKNLLQADFSTKGHFFIRTQNVRPFIIDKEGMSCLNPAIRNYPKLGEGDILAVRVGEGVGDTSIVTPEFYGHSFSDNVLRIKIIELNPYYVIIYLNSKFGRAYLERVSKGSARSLVSSENFYLIRIPDLGNSAALLCKEKILEAQSKINESESIYINAENLLLEELGMADYQHDSKLSNVVNFEDLKSARRMDAEYFQPKYAKLEKKIKEHDAQRLGDLVTVKKGIEPGAETYLEEGKLFIRVSSLTKLGIIDKDQKYLSENLYKELKKDYEPKVGEILLTKDASPGISYVVKEAMEGIISGGIVRLKLKEQNIEPEYLALCISSIVGQAQAQRDAGGSVIMHWKPEQIKNLLVPVLPRNMQKKISELVIQSHEARKKAKELLEQAKYKVEELIESGGDRNE